MRILVTGASGFVGSNTCSHLEAAGHDVIRVVHSQKFGLLNEYSVDIAEAESFAALNNVGDIDAIVHCAGIAHRFGQTSRDEFWRVNVDGARNVADFAARKQVNSFVHLSSVLVYGPSTSSRPVAEDQTPAPGDNYAASKLAGEVAVSEVCSAGKMNLTILRPVPVIGEGSRGNISRLIRALDRKRFVWIGDGRNVRSFVDVSDVAGAVLASIGTNGSLMVFNVTGGTMTVRGMLETVSDELGRPCPAPFVPHKAAKLAVAVSKPLAGLPGLGVYHRTLETWLSNGVYSGEAVMRSGFVPATDVRESLRNEVRAYLRSKH